MPFIFHCPRIFVSFQLILLILPRMQNRRYLTSLLPLSSSSSRWLFVATEFQNSVVAHLQFYRQCLAVVSSRESAEDRFGSSRIRRISEFCRCRGNSKGTKILRWRFMVVLECTIQINCAVIAVPPFEYRFHLNVNSSEKFSKYPRDLITNHSYVARTPVSFDLFTFLQKRISRFRVITLSTLGNTI